MAKRTVVLGLLGTTLDQRSLGPRRWDRWRPTVDLCRHEDLLVSRLELLHATDSEPLAKVVEDDVRQVSPETEVRRSIVEFDDPWDFEEVYAKLFDFVRAYRFRAAKEDYLVHISTGTHVAQICWFLLIEAHHIPGRLLQTSPSTSKSHDLGKARIIDLDLSKYDQISSRYRAEQQQDLAYLKAGIATRNPAFNSLIEQIEQVVVRSRAPLLLTGPTGAGKTQLSRRIYELKHKRGLVAGSFVELNCATLRGDQAMSMLFGHSKGAYTGATTDRAGLLRAADGGVLFLDEIAELGLDEQAMLLRALEDKRFLPLGSDREVSSDFQLIAGTNRDLRREVHEGRFRNDLLARLNVWTFVLPGLSERPEDIEPNLDYELTRFEARTGTRLAWSREARASFLRFATSPDAYWTGNFRDFSAAVERMATLATGGRIDGAVVAAEVERLRTTWAVPTRSESHDDILRTLVGAEVFASLDRFDRVQLADVVAVCRSAKSLSAAGRELFAMSRQARASTNDADRLRKYLARFGIKSVDLFP